MHLRVTIVRHNCSPGLIFHRKILLAHSQLLQLVHNLVLFKRIQATVETVLLAGQHFPRVLGLHVVQVIFHLSVVGYSVHGHVDCVTVKSTVLSLSEVQGRMSSGGRRAGLYQFVPVGGVCWGFPLRGIIRAVLL